MQRWWCTLAITLAATACCASAAPAANTVLRGEIYALRLRVDRAATLDAARKAFLSARLYEDQVLLDSVAQPDWMSNEEFDEYNTRLIGIDRQLVDGALGAEQSVANIRGNGAFWMRSSSDNAWQPVALYVPSGYDGLHPVRLVVYLHGRGEAENRAVAKKMNRDLAEGCACVIAAPYARGQSQYADPAPADIYQLRDFMRHEFNIDNANVYLVGYSMGGFGVFEVGRFHPERWSAFLAIAGGLTGEDRTEVTQRFRGKRVYLVSGTKDEDIPNAHIRKSVDDLRAHGIETKYYEVPGASHSTFTMHKAIAQAWSDMLAGVHGSLEPLERATNGLPRWLPQSAPSAPPRKT